MSKNSEKLKGLLLELFGSEVRLIPEYCVGENLRLDFYLPDHKLGAEHHGRQHKEFVEHFHKNIAGFKDSQRRDRRKLDLCAEQGITVFVTWDDELLTLDLVKARIDEALKEVNVLEKEPTESLIRKKTKELRKATYEKYKDSPQYEANKELAKKLRKEKYQWMKEKHR